MVVRDMDHISNRLFRTNEKFTFLSTVSRTEKCNCPGAIETTRTFYIVKEGEKTYELDAAFVREVDCNDPPQTVAGHASDEIAGMSAVNPGFEHLVKEEVRNDKWWAENTGVTFDLRDKG